MIVIVDYHGQYVHRIWRSLDYLGVESKIVSNTTSASEISKMNPEGIILSGGPYSVYSDEDRLGDYFRILELDLPILGICLGHQIIAKKFGGVVKQGVSGEYAEVEITVKEENDLFKGLGDKLTVWESHRDEVVSIPNELTCLASSRVCEIEALKHTERRIYGVQFHPEVYHTPKGSEILKNFVGVCAAEKKAEEKS